MSNSISLGYSPSNGATGAKAELPLYATAYGCVADGDVDAGTGTDNTTALQALINDAMATGRPAYLPAGVYRFSTTQLTFTSGLTLIGEPGTVLFKDHDVNAFGAAPFTLVNGTVTAQADNGLVQVAGAAFTVDAYAGHYCQVTTNDSGGTARQQRRKILSNTSDTLTLEYDLSLTPADGDAVAIYDILSGVVIENITVQAPTTRPAAGAGFDLSFVDNLRMTNVSAIGHAGDGISINTGRNIRLENCLGENSFFGIFLYNCHDALLTNCVGKDVTSSYHIELKECRDSAMVGCYAEGGPHNGTPTGDFQVVGLHIHANGLNPSFNVHIIGGTAYNIPGEGLSAAASHEEAIGGTPFDLENVSLNGSVWGNGGTSVGLQFLNTTTGAMRNARGYGLQVVGTQIGLSVQAHDVSVTDFSIDHCTAQSITGVLSDRVTLSNGVVRDGLMGGAAGDEVILQDCNDWTVTNVSAVHTDVNSLANQFLAEQGASDRNHIIDCRVLDSGAYSSGHYNVTGLGSRVANTVRRHQSLIYAAAVTPDCDNGEIVDVDSLTGNITVNAPLHPRRGFLLTLNFTQDATGGRAVTLDAVFKANWTPSTTANAVNTITFEYSGTKWVQRYAAVGL